MKPSHYLFVGADPAAQTMPEDQPPARSKTRRPVVVAVAVLLVGAAAFFSLSQRGPQEYRSVPELVEALNSGGFECALAFDPATSQTSIMGTTIRYEDGWCRMPDDRRLFIRVFGSQDEAREYRSEMFGGVGMLVDTNWEVRAPSKGVAREVLKVLGGYFTGRFAS